MYRCNALRANDESRHQREGGNSDGHVAGKAGLIEKLLIESRLQGAPGIPHYMLQTFILFQSQQLLQFVCYPSKRRRRISRQISVRSDAHRTRSISE